MGFLRELKGEVKHLLQKKVRSIGYGARSFDVDGVYKWMKTILETLDTDYD